MTEDFSEARRQYVADLDAAGSLPDPKWYDVFAQVQRHRFLPRFFLPTPDGRWQAIDATHPDYTAQVYSDTTLTTQLDGSVDPKPDAGPVNGVSTSSSTQPSLMAYMLHALNLTGAEQVLEIGTGTGYNAALLSQRLGDDHVTTIEVDPVISYRATTRLASGGYMPEIINDDGVDADVGTHDRVIATCSVPAVPRGWINRTRDGGLIVTSLWRSIGGGPLVRLEVNDRTAQGFFLPQFGGFMPVRSATRTSPALSKALTQVGEPGTAKTGSPAVFDEHSGLWIALLVPDVAWLGFTPDGGVPQFWLFAPDGSWSMLDETTMRVAQHGPRRLWDEIEQAHRLWEDSGAPIRERLGLTVTPDGTHRFWLDTPEEELWTGAPRS
jgi:protein-L-isoaspartate(D-aspartate) O-methyltransferase